MSTETINFRLGKTPLIKEKIIVLEETDGRKAVIFPMYRQKHEIEHAEVAKEGEVLELTGKWGTDKKTGKPQFYVDKAYNAKMQKETTKADPIAVPGDISQSRQVADKSAFIKLRTLKDIKAAMDANFYPGALFPGDPYAIDPETDFTESDKIKTFTVSDKIFFTDSILVWEKDNAAIRNKFVLSPKLREHS